MRGPTTSSYRGFARRGLTLLWSAIVCSLMATLAAAVPVAAAPPSEQTIDFANAIDLSMELTPEGLPIISYVDSDAEELIHIVCDDPACEGTEEAVVVAQAKHSDMAIDSSGLPVLVFSSADGPTHSLVRCSTVTCEGLPDAVDGSRGLLGELPGANSVSPLPAGMLFDIGVALDSNDHPVIMANTLLEPVWIICDDLSCVGEDLWQTTAESGFGLMSDVAVDPFDRPVLVSSDGFGAWFWRCNSSFNCGSPVVELLGSSPTDLEIAYTASGLPAVSSNGGMVFCSDLVCGEEAQSSAEAFLGGNAAGVAIRPGVATRVTWVGSTQQIRLTHCRDEFCSKYTVGEFPVSPNLGSVDVHEVVARFGNDDFLTIAVASDSGVHVFRCADRRCRSTDLVGADDDYNATEDEPLLVSGDGVLANDVDNSLDGIWVTAALVAPPENGELAFGIRGNFQYTPDPGFSGADTFTYRMVDEFAGVESAVLTVTINVEPVNKAPVATADTATTTAGAPVTINVVDGSAGGADTDADDDSLIVTSVTSPDKGGSAVPSEETILYTPADGFVGEEMFDYTVADGNGGSDTATVTVTVLAPATPPPPPGPTCGGKAVTVDLSKGQSPTAKADVILGTSAPEVIDGLGGNDTICGRGGSDTINGGGGNDLIIGGGGGDIVAGGKGKDRLVGGKGNDKLTGGKGGDILLGGGGKDRLAGGAGNDKLNGGAGTDTCKGGPGTDTLAKCEK